MLSSLLRQGSIISQEWFCLSNCHRPKIILVGTHPEDFCPHKLLHSSVLDFIPPAPFQQDSWSPLWQWSHFLRDWERLWVLRSTVKEQSPWLRMNQWMWFQKHQPAQKRFLRCRGSTQIRAGIGMKCRNSCNASKQGQSISEFIWTPGHSPPSNAAVGVKGQGKSCKYG